eukprot:6765681-Alexandrium_andersonii.AAC.1
MGPKLRMEEAAAHPHQARRAGRLCPALGIGGSRRPLQLLQWARWAPREARRPQCATPKPRGRR